MALRHSFPEFEIDPDKYLVEPMRVPPRAVAPKTLEFRKGADLGPLLDTVAEEKLVQINAATGAGKSVRLPAEVARVLGQLVVHVVPSRLLAWSQYKYVSTLDLGVAVQHIYDVDVPMNPKGLVIMSSAAYVAREIGRSAGFSNPHVLVLDEWHESDCCTNILRDVAVSKPHVLKVVRASATADTQDFRVRELESAVTVSTYSAADVPETWDVHEKGKPWSEASISDHTLIFVDREKVATSLVSEYSDVGFNAHRLSAKMSFEEFDAAVNALSDPSKGVVILVADYSFRSGFTLPVTNVIDGGEVGFLVSDGRDVSRRFRPAYAGEREQAVARVGRLPGRVCHAYVPDGDVLYSVCDLEGVESDATALLMRYMGHKPHASLRSSFFSKGEVPRYLCRALNASAPLALIALKDLAAWPGLVPRACADERKSSLTPPSPVVEEAKRVEVRAADVAQAETNIVGSLGLERLPEGDQDTLVSATCDEVDFEKILQAVQGDSVEIKPGCYYRYPGVESAPDASIAFPKGLASVLALMEQENFEYYAKCMSYDDKLFAISVLLYAYNEATAEINAIKKLVGIVPQLTRSINKLANPKVFDAWVVSLAEVLTSRSAEVTCVTKVMIRIADDDFIPLLKPSEAEVTMIVKHSEALKSQLVETSESADALYAKKLAARAQSSQLRVGPGSSHQQLIVGNRGHLKALSGAELKPESVRQLAIGKSKEVGIAQFRYKLSTDIGAVRGGGHLRSVWTQALIKLAGTGNMTIFPPEAG